MISLYKIGYRGSDMNRISLTKIGPYFALSFILGYTPMSKASLPPPPSPINAKMSNEAANAESENKTASEISPFSHDTLTQYKQPIKSSAISLSGIIKEALTHQPSINADKQALSAAEEVITQAKAGYMPTVDLRASVGRDNFRRSFGINSLNPLASSGTISTTRSDPSVIIRQILFDGNATSSRVARARSQQQQARGTLGITTDTAILDAATAAIDIRRLQRLLRIADNNIRFHQSMKEKVAEIVQAGAAPISDLYQVDSRLQDTFVTKSNIQSDLEVAKAKFIEVVGKEAPDQIKRIKLPAYLIPDSIEMAVRMAIDNNNAIKVAKSNVQIAESTNKESSSKLVPTITLELEGEKDRNMSATTGSQGRLTAMVVARHNLFNGGADLAKSRETIKRLSESHARLGLSLRQIERTVRTSYAEHKNALSKSAHLTKLIKEKRNIRNAYLNEFIVAKRSLIDNLDSANDVFITEATRTTVDATADINTIVLSVATGQFQKHIARGEFEEEEENVADSASDKKDFEAALQLTGYTPNLFENGLKTEKNTPKKVALKRKSVFEARKEEREDALSENELSESKT